MLNSKKRDWKEWEDVRASLGCLGNWGGERIRMGERRMAASVAGTEKSVCKLLNFAMN